MIRYRASRDGKPSIGLGLSRENVNRLTNGEPILVSGDSIGMPELDSIFVFFGETEKAMYDDLSKYFAPETIVHVDPKLEDSR